VNVDATMASARSSELCGFVRSSLHRPAFVSGEYGSDRVVTLDALLVSRQRWRRDGRVVVWTNGCFDLLHAGHIYGLEQARRLGDILVVGVNDDEAVRALKGPDRPIYPLVDRLRMIAALRAPDLVVPFSEPTPEATLADLQPDVHVKGRDYAPPSGKPIPERAVVESYGGRIAFVDLLPGHSTSELIDRIGQRVAGDGWRRSHES
jgi:D-glycero-beta-D-manno-heptose 1-phosphate adenylyltransferase